MSAARPESAPVDRPLEDGELVRWTAHPAAEQPARAAAALAVIMACGAAVALGEGHAGWAAGVCGFMVLVLGRFFLPTRYELGPDGLVARHWLGDRRIAWQEVRRLGVDDRGAVLSRRAHPSRHERGAVPVLFGGRRDEVLPAIRARLPREEAAR